LIIALSGARVKRYKKKPMIRPVLSELAFFLAPFAAYAIYVLATRGGILHPEAWSARALAWLTAAALVSLVGSFFVLAHFSGDPIGSTYIPAHMENGQFVPAQTR
jgi:hypothetical protein